MNVLGISGSLRQGSYNTALLRAAMELAPDQPFDGKPVAIMGASLSMLGSAFANHHLRQILVYLNAQMLNGPEVLVGGAAGKFDARGRLTDEATRSFVAGHLSGLKKLALRLKA